MAAVTTPIVALDVPSASTALHVVDELGDLCRYYKVGSELFIAAGPPLVKDLRSGGAEVFLDLKLHDIPNTVAGAVRSASALDVSLLTVHAAGGEAMLRAAVEAARRAGRCRILAVSVLTSLDSRSLAAAWGRKEEISVVDEVIRLAETAVASGADGLVCSGLEAARVRERFGSSLELLVPGVRLAGGATQDQTRVVTPRQAREAGARYVVIGRAVTATADRAAAMRQILDDLS